MSAIRVGARLSLLALCLGLPLSTTAQAACYTPQIQLPARTVSAFVANPSQMLQLFRSGGPQMISQVRDLAASDPATLQAILGLIANANSDQKKAIGAGLAQAARICVRTEQAY